MTDYTATAELHELVEDFYASDTRRANWLIKNGQALLGHLDAQAEELAALRRNRAAWEASGQDAEKRSRYAEARVSLLEAEIARLGKEIERRDQSLAIRRKTVREAFGLVRPLKARIRELEAEVVRLGSEIERRNLCIRSWESIGQSSETMRREREKMLLAHAHVDCSDCMGTGSYLGTDRNGLCLTCCGVGKILPPNVAAALGIKHHAPDSAMPSSRGTTSGELLQLHDRAERPDAYAVADSEGGEA